MTERYTHGHFGTVVDNHAARTAASSAAFLVPHLKDTDRVLDIGCGPGSITLDLAVRIGTITGVDASPEAVARAARDAATRNTTNASFVVGSVYQLEFPDDEFDVVYAHQLLQHLQDPVAALEEAKRVLKPGGIVAVRDADYGTMVHDPPEPLIDLWLDLYHVLARRNGGEPDAGRKLGRWVAAAGFVDITISTDTWTYSTPDAIEGWRQLWKSRLLEARMGRDLISFGLADQREIEDMAAAFDRWATTRQPFFAFLHGEVVARKPAVAE